MNFGEKLYALRKERGFSQEELAGKLNSSRQAISKWENNQGFPETEKLLMLGNIFEVSIDYLLKESNTHNSERNNTYYVSKEMAEGYILSEKRNAKSIALATLLLLLAGVPYNLLQDNKEIQIIAMAILITLSIIIIVVASLKEETKYKVIKQQPLLFDKAVLTELQDRSTRIYKKYTTIIIFSVATIIIGFIPILLSNKEFLVVSNAMFALSFILLGAGFFGFIVSVTVIETYRLLARNEEHSNKLHIKIMRKIRKFID